MMKAGMTQLTKPQAEHLICIHAVGTMGKGKNRGKVLDSLIKAGMVIIIKEEKPCLTFKGCKFAEENHLKYNWQCRVYHGAGISGPVL